MYTPTPPPPQQHRRPPSLSITSATLAAAFALLLAAGALSWLSAGTLGRGGGLLRAADAAFVTAHALAALGVGACAHLGWDLFLLAVGAMPGPFAPIQYAWDWGAAVAGVVLVRQLGGLPWRHVRLKIVGALLFASAVLLALLRWGRAAGGAGKGVPGRRMRGPGGARGQADRRPLQLAEETSAVLGVAWRIPIQQPNDSLQPTGAAATRSACLPSTPI